MNGCTYSFDGYCTDEYCTVKKVLVKDDRYIKFPSDNNSFTETCYKNQNSKCYLELRAIFGKQ